MPLTPIPPSAGIPTYLDTGVPNALSIAVSGLSSYSDFQLYNVVIANANNGNTTFQINSLAALPLLTAAGDQLLPGQLQAGQIATIETRGSDAYLLNPFNSFSPQYQLFTANGNYTPLVSGNYLVYLRGGGGGGGAGLGVNPGTAEVGEGGFGGGQGGDGYFIVPLVAGTAYPIVIGGGGLGGITNGGSDGSDGTATTFNGVQTAAGGKGGRSSTTQVKVTALDLVRSGQGGNGSGPGGGQGGAWVNGQNPGNAGVTAPVNSGAGGGGGSGASNAAGTTANNGGAGGNGGSGQASVMRVS